MALLNQKGFERKLQQMSSAQDSVQTVSLWIIHHKKYANDIVKVWMDHIKRCNPDRRLVMLYLANDVLQNSRKKGKEFSTAFSKVLKETIPLLCDRKIIDAVQRVMKIWQERKVFEKDFLESLQRKLESSQSKSTKIPSRRESNGEDTAIELVERQTSHQHTEKRLPPADFKPQQLIDALKAMRDFQAEVTLKESQLNSLRIDASDTEAIKQLKDRATGAKFTSEYEAASEKLESFCETLNQEKEEITRLIKILDDGRSFYDSAFGEVKIIVHAYKTFGNRLNSLKKKVDHKVAKIINEEAEKKKMGPITTPGASFLTSGLPDISSGTPSSTPPHKTDEGEKVTDTTVDNTEVADMDLEDDADSENGQTSESPSETASTPSTESKTSETTKSDVSLKPQVTMTTLSASTVPASKTSTVTTSVAFTGTSSAMQVRVPVPQQMVMPQPNMQFIPGQPGMPMIPVGMHGTGQFIAMPSQYPQPMVPFGMPIHGINTFPGSVQTHMTGLLPGQTSFPGQNIGLVSNLPQQIQSNVSIPQISVHQDLSVQGTPVQPVNHTTTTTASSVTPQVSNVITNVSDTKTDEASKPFPSNVPSNDASEASESRQDSMESPSSEMSAPSPIGSPELELGGDETPETASPQRISDVKIIGFPSIPSHPETTSGKEPVQVNLHSEGTSGTSTGTTTPNHTSELSQPVSAVNILAQLISRGRKLKEQTPDIDVPSEVSTPKEEAVEASQPQPGKPLFSLIDSLFPKLTDSLKTIREREKDNETSTSTSEEGSPKQKIEINSMENDDDSEVESGKLTQGSSLEQTDKNIEDRGPFKGPYHAPTGPPQEVPMAPYGIRPPEGPVRQPWNNAPFQGHPGGPRPPFIECQGRPHVPPSPLKGPGHSPRFPGPQRPFERPAVPPPQAEFIDSEGMQEGYRPGPERSPRQIHSPRGGFPGRPSPGVPGGYPVERGPPPGMHPDEPPINGPPRSPRGSFVGPHGMPREEQMPHFHFDGPHGTHPRPPGPPDVYGRPPGGSPRHSPIDGPPKPRWRGPEGPRGPFPPPPHDGRPRGFQRSHSDGGPAEMGEPPMKRPILEEGHPQPYPQPGRPRFPHDERVPIDRNRELWREQEPWDHHRDPHLGPRPDRNRTPNEFPDREEHLPRPFIEQDNPFPRERLRFQPPRRNSFKGYEENEFHHREHTMDHRPRLPFPGPHPRPFF